MRKQLFKVAAMSVACMGVLAGARTAAAASSTHGVVFIHGTGDSPVSGQTSPSLSALTCTSVSGFAGTSCYAPAAYGGSNYWEANEVSSIAGGRPFAVVGFNGGSCAPWPQSGDSTYGHVSNGSSCPLPTNVGNGDIIVQQIQQFISANPGMNELVIITHSGGSNQARYILDNSTRNSYYSTVAGMTKRVITLAGTTDGTYLANEVFSGGITSLIGGLVGYGGEGVNLLRTNYMNTYNSSSSFLGPKSNPVDGVNFYASGGVSGSTCVGVKVFGVCIGVTAQTLGGIIGACDSAVDDAALLLLHDLWLDTNDSSTYRNSCSDGFISCMGSQALGNTFNYSEGQDHNQSRRVCNNLPAAVASKVSGSVNGFSYGLASSQVSPVQVDACGFTQYSYQSNSRGQTVSYHEGCGLSQLGNGNCDWDCVAMYGNDAVVTSWANPPTNTLPLTWGASDCGPAGSGPVTNAATTNTYNGVTYVDTSPLLWAESSSSLATEFLGTYTTSSGTYASTFTGLTCTGTTAQCGGYSTSYQWFYDPNAGYYWTDTSCTSNSQCSSGSCVIQPNQTVGVCGCTSNSQCTSGLCELPSGATTGLCSATSQKVNGNGEDGSTNSGVSAGYCPQSWIGDGTCDECVLAVYGQDGNDCLPGHIVQCGGIVEKYQGYCPAGVSNCGSTNSYYYTQNPVYNEGQPSDHGGEWLVWSSWTAVGGDGICENTECTAAVSTSNYYGTDQCASNSDCPSGSQCVGNAGGGLGGCATVASGNDCVATWAVTPRSCNTNADCNGNSCQNPTGGTGAGTCLLTNGTCTTDGDCPASGTVTELDPVSGTDQVAWTATSQCNSGVCSCSSAADCSGGATCSNPGLTTGTCSTTATQSLCR